MSDLAQRIANLSPQQRALLERRLLKRGTAAAEQPAIPRRATSEPCPLSFSQQWFWFLDQLGPNGFLYNLPEAIRMRGPLDLQALHRALDAVVARHAALRTTFVLSGQSPVQVIAASGSVDMPVIDLRDYPPSQREAQVHEVLRLQARRPFDLSRDLMLRAVLLRLEEQEHMLLLVMHHIASDGWSMGVLYRELGALYEACSAGKPSPLPDLPIQYADFAAWQREWLQGEALEGQVAYWRRQLAGAPAALELPTDHPRPAVQTFTGTCLYMTVPKALTEALHALSRREGGTLFMTLLAAFKTLLYRYTGQEDIVVGSPIAGRNRVELEQLIGFFVNMLVLRTDLSGDPTFRELLSRVREVTLGAYTHQDASLDKLVEELHPQRHLSHSTLFQVEFILQNTPGQALELSGLTLSPPEEVDFGTANPELTLSLTEDAAGLKGSWRYNTDLFETDTIRRMIGHYQTLLEGIVGDPNQRISRLPLLTAEERHQVLVEWNDTGSDVPPDACLHELFEAQADRTPEATAVVFGRQQMSYGELNARANQLAHHLRTLGVGPETLVGVCLKRSVEMVVGVLGILKAGGAYVPLDPDNPADRVHDILNDCAARVLVTTSEFAGIHQRFAGSVVRLDADQAAFASEPAQPLTRENTDVTPNNLCYVIYTSGSTGRPKGVPIEHRSVYNLVRAEQGIFRIAPEDRVYQGFSLAFDASVEEIWLAFAAGATLILGSTEMRYGGPALPRVLTEAGVSVLSCVPTLLSMMEDDVPTVRLLIVGGETCPQHLVTRWSKPGRRMVNTYGPTEATVIATYAELHPGRPVTIGRPIPNTEIYILDARQQPVPIGVAGEVCIAGAGLARGYLNRPELTAEKFIPNPFSREPGARLYRTGDRARYGLDGNIEFLGRIDTQVKIRGFRVELGEIEAALGQHPTVRETVVVARKVASGDERLVAYLVPHGQQRPAPADLRSFLRSKLPDYMIPTAFVILDALPLTPNGKIDHGALPGPDPHRPDPGRRYVAPRNSIERRLVDIWEKTLGIERISVTDNFFDLGGHSLLAVRVFVAIERKLDRSLPLATIVAAPTIEQLAAVIRAAPEPPRTGCLVVLQGEGARPPLFCVSGIHGHVVRFRRLAMYLGTDQPVYGLHYPGLDGQQEPLTRVEDIAAEFIRNIRRVQPQGPYFLCGFSYGGLVVYEMAQQFRAQDQPVALVALLYTLTPELDTYALKLLLPKPSPRRMEAGDNRPSPSSSLVDWIERVSVANLQAGLRYQPQPYLGRAILFRKESRYLSDPLNGWGDLVRGGLEVQLLPDHIKTFKEPHVRFFGEKMRECLLAAQASQTLTA